VYKGQMANASRAPAATHAPGIVGPFAGMDVPWLLRMRSERRGDHPFLIWAPFDAPARNWTYREFHDRVGALAAGLVKRGIRPGDRVALVLPSEELVIALHGCLLLGAVAVPIDLRLQAAERAHRMDGATLVLDELVQGAPADPRDTDGDSTATLMFTSGTTAGPKPVALSYDNWLWNAIGSALSRGLDPADAARKLRLLWVSCGDQDRLMTISQSFHTALEEKKVPHIWHVDSGRHEWPVWKNDMYLLAPLLFRDR